jgi:hypothetical protein
MDLREIGWVNMDWIRLTQNRYQWRALVYTVMNFRFQKMLGNSLVAERLLAFQGPSSMELHSSGGQHIMN